MHGSFSCDEDEANRSGHQITDRNPALALHLILSSRGHFFCHSVFLSDGSEGEKERSCGDRRQEWQSRDSRRWSFVIPSSLYSQDVRQRSKSWTGGKDRRCDGIDESCDESEVTARPSLHSISSLIHCLAGSRARIRCEKCNNWGEGEAVMTYTAMRMTRRKRDVDIGDQEEKESSVNQSEQKSIPVQSSYQIWIHGAFRMI